METATSFRAQDLIRNSFCTAASMGSDKDLTVSCIKVVWVWECIFG